MFLNRKHDNYAIKVSYICNYLKLVFIISPFKPTVPWRTNQFSLDFSICLGKGKAALNQSSKNLMRQVVKATSIQYCWSKSSSTINTDDWEKKSWLLWATFIIVHLKGKIHIRGVAKFFQVRNAGIIDHRWGPTHQYLSIWSWGWHILLQHWVIDESRAVRPAYIIWQTKKNTLGLTCALNYFAHFL